MRIFNRRQKCKKILWWMIRIYENDVKGYNQRKYTVVGEATDKKLMQQENIELKPDLVTMDMIMPEMNGIDAVKKKK